MLFSQRQAPIVANYSLRKSYGKLIDHFVDSFYRKDKRTGKNLPILALAVYSPYEDTYYIGKPSKIDDMVSGRQQQIVNLIRQLLLKRFESSIEAFAETCIRIYARLRKFLNDYQDYGNKKQIERLMNIQADISDYVDQWTEGDGLYRWYFVRNGSDQISEQTYDIWKLIQCAPDTNRVLVTTEEEFSERRKLVETHIKKTYMRAIQAPLGVKIRLVTWMQLC